MVWHTHFQYSLTTNDHSIKQVINPQNNKCYTVQVICCKMVTTVLTKRKFLYMWSKKIFDQCVSKNKVQFLQSFWASTYFLWAKILTKILALWEDHSFKVCKVCKDIGYFINTSLGVWIWYYSHVESNDCLYSYIDEWLKIPALWEDHSFKHLGIILI